MDSLFGFISPSNGHTSETQNSLINPKQAPHQFFLPENTDCV